MAPRARAAFLLVGALLSTANGKTSCKSAMPGDFGHEACGAFCKIDKKANHCR